jgi:hypothetical protein
MVEKHPLLDRLCRVWLQVSNKPVPNIYNLKRSQLPITQLERMIKIDPELCEALFKTPVEKINDGELQSHILDNKYWTTDEGKLREHGYYQAAETIRNEKIKYEQDKINKQIEESKQRQKVAEERSEQWSNMSLGERMMAEPLTQDQILRNRERYGVG